MVGDKNDQNVISRLHWCHETAWDLGRAAIIFTENVKILDLAGPTETKSEFPAIRLWPTNFRLPLLLSLPLLLLGKFPLFSRILISVWSLICGFLYLSSIVLATLREARWRRVTSRLGTSDQPQTLREILAPSCGSKRILNQFANLSKHSAGTGKRSNGWSECPGYGPGASLPQR